MFQYFFSKPYLIFQFDCFRAGDIAPKKFNLTQCQNSSVHGTCGTSFDIEFKINLEGVSCDDTDDLLFCHVTGIAPEPIIFRIGS